MKVLGHIFLFFFVAHLSAQGLNFDISDIKLDPVSQNIVCYVSTDKESMIYLLDNKEKISIKHSLHTDGASSEMQIKNLKVVDEMGNEQSLINSKYHVILDIGPTYSNEDKETVFSDIVDKLLATSLKNKTVNIYLLGKDLELVSKEHKWEKDESVLGKYKNTSSPFVNFNKLIPLVVLDQSIILVTDGFISERDKAEYLNGEDPYGKFRKSFIEKLKLEAHRKLCFYPISHGVKEINKEFFGSITQATNADDSFSINSRLPRIERNFDFFKTGMQLKIELETVSDNLGPQYKFSPQHRNVAISVEHLRKVITKDANFKTEIFAVQHNSQHVDEVMPESVNKSVLFFTAGLLALLFYVVPTYNSYLFKKDKIIRFKDSRFSKSQVRDPFTYERLVNEDLVVESDDKVLLLESWKNIKKAKDLELKNDYAAFYQTETMGGLFDQYNTRFKFLYWGFLMVAAAYISWAIYYFLMSFPAFSISSTKMISAEFSYYKLVLLDRLSVYGAVILTTFLGVLYAGSVYAGTNKLRLSKFLLYLVLSIPLVIFSLYIFDQLLKGFSFHVSGIRLVSWWIIMTCILVFVKLNLELSSEVLVLYSSTFAILATLLSKVLYCYGESLVPHTVSHFIIILIFGLGVATVMIFSPHRDANVTRAKLSAEEPSL